MSEKLNIGKLIKELQDRDAIHVAVAPAVAGEKLLPGQHCGFHGTDLRKVYSNGQRIGVVDPYLKEPVMEGDRFWLFLYPGSVTSLRHDWEHPTFTAAAVAEKLNPNKDEIWLREFAAQVGLSYEQLMEDTAAWVEYVAYANYGSLLDGQDVPDEFWPHYEAVTGTKVKSDKQSNFFSCSC